MSSRVGIDLSMAIEPFAQHTPRLDAPAFIAASADLIGQVNLAPGSSVWYNATLRADLAPIDIGENTNVQDNACIHVETGLPCRLGSHVTIGHNATLHACTVENNVLVGMGAIVLDGAVIGHGSIVGAHALVTKNTIIPPLSLVLGSPANVIRTLNPAAEDSNRVHAQEYLELARTYAAR